MSFHFLLDEVIGMRDSRVRGNNAMEASEIQCVAGILGADLPGCGGLPGTSM